MNLQPHQQRVVEEKSELDEKLSKLSAFTRSSKFSTMVADGDERYRLRVQEEIMKYYSKILAERITAFTHISG